MEEEVLLTSYKDKAAHRRSPRCFELVYIIVTALGYILMIELVYMSMIALVYMIMIAFVYITMHAV